MALGDLNSPSAFYDLIPHALSDPTECERWAAAFKSSAQELDTAAEVIVKSDCFLTRQITLPDAPMQVWSAECHSIDANAVTGLSVDFARHFSLLSSVSPSARDTKTSGPAK